MRLGQLCAGLAVFATGLAATAGLIPPLADYTYPIAWWGLLPVLDAWNLKQRGLSLWNGRARHFLLITVPLSVLFWLLFEVFNLAAPQWHYRGGIHDISAQALFGFVSFATVIPIMVECYWVLGGEFCLPAGVSSLFRRRRMASIVVGLLFAAIPFCNRVFWFNQGIWLAPAFVLLPFSRIRPCKRAGGFVAALVFSALLAGLLWESLNYWARTHWEYLILPGAPHLFQMPLPGYIGFIPFGLTALVLYEKQLRWRARAGTGVLLYATALVALYILTDIYMHRGLWVLL